MSGEQAPAVLSTRKRNRHDRPLLCGVDAAAGGRAVVSIAGALAARLHAPLILVHVDSDGEPRSARTGERARRLLDTSDMRSLRGVEVRTRWEYGDPTTRLTRSSRAFSCSTMSSSVLVLSPIDQAAMARPATA